jgi:hypothetical protein
LRFAFTFLSLVAAIAATGFAWQFPRLGWLIPFYLALDTILNLCGWWGIIQPGVFESRAYLLFVAIGQGLVLIFALLVAISFPLDFWVGVFFIPLVALASLAGAFRLWSAAPDTQGKLALIQGAVMLACGVYALTAALVEQMTPEKTAAAFWLGIFWLASGAFGWCYAVKGAAWNSANEWAPSLVELICLASLAIQLNGIQKEMARQHSRDEVALSEMQHMEAQP